MPAFNYARLRRTANRLIGRFAQAPATLHVIATAPDGEGGVTRTSTDVPCKAVRLDYDSIYRVQAGIPDSDVRILVARLGLVQDVNLDCQITIGAERFRIVPPIKRDPADAMWDLQGRPV